MECQFYQPSPYNQEETYVVESYELTEDQIPSFKRRMEDYLAFYFFLKNNCPHHNAEDVKIHFLEHAFCRFFTINANCKRCCQSHNENMHHVNFRDNNKFVWTRFYEVIERRNLLFEVNNPYTPSIIFQWPLLLSLYCAEKRDVFIYI